MSNSSNPTDAFRFLDLPKEVRFMVYERLPRTKTHHRITLFPDQHPSCVLVVKSIPMSILATCRMIHDEDGPFVQKMARKFVYNTAPKVIMTIDFAAYPETENHRALFHAMIGAIQRYKKHDIYKDSIGTALSKSKITQSCGFKDALMDVLVSQGMINPVMAFIH
jgi:reverse gyrase